MISKYKNKTSFHIFIIFLAGFLLCLPQIISKNMIIGSDAIFHFNRYYDTAQQIKNNNYNYFISLYGYQQTGRIITPLYSSIFSYFFGFILLICGSWYKFQLVTNFLLFITSGSFMYLLLKKTTLNKNLSLKLSLFYMTTFSISYWVIRQGYSSWGAAFFPLCLIPIVDMINKKEFDSLKIGLSVSLMFQLHFISSFILVLLYFFAFIYCLMTYTDKVKLFQKLALAILIFGLLNFNIWIAFLSVYGNNDIVQPFINQYIYKSTITKNSFYWVITPILLPLILATFLFTVVRKFKQMSDLSKYFSVMTIIFLILSSNLFPWKLLYDKNVQFINIIQFPFRLFIPATVCLICSFGLYISEKTISFNFDLQKFGLLALIICFAHSIILYTKTLSEWNSKNSSFIPSAKHTFITTTNYEKVKKSFYSDDLSLALTLVEKSTPDYLPRYNNSNENNYELYEKYVLFNNKTFNKEIKHNKLILKWNSRLSNEKTIIPVIKYQKTKLILNGKEVNNVDLTTIGNPIIESKLGNNTLKLSYE